jgi:hypothetical protein
VPLLQEGPCGPTPYAIEPPANTCASQPVVRSLGGVWWSQAYALDGAGTCSPKPSADALYALSEPLDLSQFAGATEEVEAGSGRFGLLVLQADDGARQVLSAYDNQLGGPAHPELAGDGGYQCVPSRVAYAYAGLFSDPACTQRGAQKLTDTAACPLTAVLEYEFDESPGICQQTRYRYRRLGPAVAAGYQQGDDGGCSLASTNSLSLSYSVGDPLSADAFAPFSHTSADAGLALEQDATPEQGPLLPTAGSVLLDRAHGWACAPLLDEDGASRCLPLASTSSVYSDPSCTQPAYGFDVECADISTAPPWPSPCRGTPVRRASRPTGWEGSSAAATRSREASPARPGGSGPMPRSTRSRPSRLRSCPPCRCRSSSLRLGGPSELGQGGGANGRSSRLTGIEKS